MAQPAEYGPFIDQLIESGPGLPIERWRQFVEMRVGRLVSDGTIIPQNVSEFSGGYDYPELTSMSEQGTLVSVWRNSEAQSAGERYDVMTWAAGASRPTRWRGAEELYTREPRAHVAHLRLALAPFLGSVTMQTPMRVAENEERRQDQSVLQLPHLLLTEQGCSWVPEQEIVEVLEPLQHGVRRMMREAGVTQLY